jgi:hypothetical protein
VEPNTKQERGAGQLSFASCEEWSEPIPDRQAIAQAIGATEHEARAMTGRIRPIVVVKWPRRLDDMYRAQCARS